MISIIVKCFNESLIFIYFVKNILDLSIVSNSR